MLHQFAQRVNRVQRADRIEHELELVLDSEDVDSLIAKSKSILTDIMQTVKRSTEKADLKWRNKWNGALFLLILCFTGARLELVLDLKKDSLREDEDGMIA
jgi:hypothetical protein